jgi:ectoine hydroxylase-related dioxygenase (phytanoyl-CoA dioxygenase family)
MNHKVLSKTILNKLNITCNDKMSTVKCKENIIINKCSNAINAITVIRKIYQPPTHRFDFAETTNFKSPHGNPVILSNNDFFNKNKNIISVEELTVNSIIRTTKTVQIRKG